jgi:hypothetical protein
MPEIDVVDSTWFATPPAVVAALIADPGNWRRWWPELTLEVDEWRNEKGVRWLVPAVAGRGQGLAGSAEVWLEPMFEGVVAHFFLRLDPPRGRRLSDRRRARVTDDYRRRTKATFWALADQLDPGRVARLTSATRPPPPAVQPRSRATGGAVPGR